MQDIFCLSPKITFIECPAIKSGCPRVNVYRQRSYNRGQMWQRVSIKKKRRGDGGAYSSGSCLLTLCLIFAAASWDYATCAPTLQNLPAMFCRQLGHHSGRAPAGMPCCPSPASLPVRHTSQDSCCEVSAPSQDAIPSARQDGSDNTACCVQAVAPATLQQTAYLALQPYCESRYGHAVFDLKMDMRI